MPTTLQTIPDRARGPAMPNSNAATMKTISSAVHIRISQSASLLLAVLLQWFPMLRMHLTQQLLVPSTSGVVMRWIAVTAMTLGAHDSVSGATQSVTIASSLNVKGTNGVPFRYTILTSQYTANTFTATPLPPGLSQAGGKITGTPISNGVWKVHLTASENGRVDRTASADMTLTILSKPSLVTDLPDLNLLEDQSGQLSINVAGSTPLTYRWFFGTTLQSAVTTSNFVINAASAANIGSYRVVVSNSVGAVTSRLANVNVLLKPKLTSFPVSQSVNEGDAVTLTATATGPAPLTFSWYHNDQVITDATTDTYKIPAISADQGGNYRVRVTNAAGFAESAPFTITVQPVVPVDVVLSAASRSGNSFKFQVTGPKRGSYILWSTADLSTWTTVQTYAAPASGVLDLDVAVPNDGTGLFYKVTVTP